MLDILPRLQKTFGGAFADLVFADPPYKLSDGGITCQSGRMVSVNKGSWDKPLGAAEDHAMVKRWLEAARGAMKTDATIWITGTMHIIYSIGFALQELHFRVLNDIVWVKPAPPPNLGCRNFTHTTEIVLWASRNDGSVKGERKSKHVFNYEAMKRQNFGRQMRSFWGEPPADEELLGLPHSEREKMKRGTDADEKATAKKKIQIGLKRSKCTTQHFRNRCAAQRREAFRKTSDTKTARVAAPNHRSEFSY